MKIILILNKFFYSFLIFASLFFVAETFRDGPRLSIMDYLGISATVTISLMAILTKDNKKLMACNIVIAATIAMCLLLYFVPSSYLSNHTNHEGYRVIQ